MLSNDIKSTKIINHTNQQPGSCLETHTHVYAFIAGLSQKCITYFQITKYDEMVKTNVVNRRTHDHVCVTSIKYEEHAQ